MPCDSIATCCCDCSCSSWPAAALTEMSSVSGATRLGGTRTAGLLPGPGWLKTVWRVVVEIQATGQRVEALLLPDDPSVPVSVTLGPSGRVIYVLANMLEAGWWRIVECTPAERAIMEARGITLD